MRNWIATAAVAATLAFAAHAATAAEIEVKMLNKGSDGVAMVFEPAFIKAQPGDTVKFVSVDKGHNAETMPGMWPDGVAPVASEPSEDVTVKIEKPGVYGIRCKPHYAMGMVALIVAGEPVNLPAAKAVKQTGLAKKNFEKLLTQAEAK